MTKPIDRESDIYTTWVTRLRLNTITYDDLPEFLNVFRGLADIARAAKNVAESQSEIETQAAIEKLRATFAAQRPIG